MGGFNPLVDPGGPPTFGPLSWPPIDIFDPAFPEWDPEVPMGGLEPWQWDPSWPPGYPMEPFPALPQPGDPFYYGPFAPLPPLDPLTPLAPIAPLAPAFGFIPIPSFLAPLAVPVAEASSGMIGAAVVAGAAIGAALASPIPTSEPGYGGAFGTGKWWWDHLFGEAPMPSLRMLVLGSGDEP